MSHTSGFFSKFSLILMLLMLLVKVLPAFALDQLIVQPDQKANLEIVTTPVQTQAQGAALTCMARVALTNTGVRVVAAGGVALITQLHHQVGDAVKQGTPLVTLSMPGLAEAQNNLTQAELKARLATNNSRRDEKLFKEGLISESRLHNSQSEAQSTQANLVAAQTALAMLGAGKVKGSTIILTSPISGVITESKVEPGQRVDAGMALIKVADLSTLLLEIPLTVVQSQQVVPGQLVRIQGGAARGRITTLLPHLDNAQSVLARARITDPQKTLRPGQSVEVSIAGKQTAKTVSLPTTALVWKGNAAYVFVENEKGFAVAPVHIVRRGSSQVEVKGLSAGSKVAVQGVAALKAQWLEK